MKYIFLFLFILISVSANSQIFRYDYSNDRVWIYPTEKLYSYEKGNEVYLSISQDLVDILFLDIFKKNLSLETIELLKKKENLSTFKFYIDCQGRIIPMSFMLSKEIHDNVSEEVIKNIYNACLKLRVDTSKLSFPKKSSYNKFAIINIVINKLFKSSGFVNASSDKI